MKIIVVSDSHGSVDLLFDAIRKNSKAEVIAFCGDGHNDIEGVKKAFPDKMVIAVKGNCDWCCDYAYLEEITLCGRKIIITHGHMYGVKEGYSRINYFAQSVNADIALFGHTHSPYLDYDGRVLLMNPGSIGYHREYGILDIDDNGTITASLYPPNQYNPPITVQSEK